MTPADLARLASIAGLRLDLRLADLRKASAARAATEAQLAEVEANLQAALATEWPDPRGIALYEAWAGGQQRQLNVQLARQIAEQAVSRDAAALAFGKTQALERIEERAAAARRAERARRSGF